MISTRMEQEFPPQMQWLCDPSQQDLRAFLQRNRFRWLVTGVAGFIGSNLLETLLHLGQEVRGLDNFATGHRRYLEEVRSHVGDARWERFTFLEGDIRDAGMCGAATDGIDYVLHQAALGSVPRSINDPLTSNDVNITGFLQMLDASRKAGVRRFVYAASSSTYGDEPNLPKREERIGNPLSPYAVTKLVNEMYARVYSLTYGFHSIGLRYFNVFGPRQSPDGAYAAVIPKWIEAMVRQADVLINGDGETSRDFCYVGNVVQGNLRAALRDAPALSEVYNVAVGGRTTLNELFGIIRDALQREGIVYARAPAFQPFRTGDVRHSQADVDKARRDLGYVPLVDICHGMQQALPWYLQLAREGAARA